MRQVYLFASVAIIVGANDTHAQAIRGFVVNSDNNGLPGAEILISDSSGLQRDTVRAGNRGDFLLAVPAGQYVLEARRIGFSPARRRHVDVVGTDTVFVTLQLDLLPQRLRAVQVQAERRALKQQRVLGLSLRGIDASVMTPSEVAMAARGARTWLDVVRAGGLPGLAVTAECVRSVHALRRDCAVVLVDDVRVDDRVALSGLIEPRTISHVIYLRAAQATTLFGTGAPGGALLIYTFIGARVAR